MITHSSRSSIACLEVWLDVDGGQRDEQEVAAELLSVRLLGQFVHLCVKTINEWGMGDVSSGKRVEKGAVEMHDKENTP